MNLCPPYSAFGGPESFAGTLYDPGQTAGMGVRRRQLRMSQENSCSNDHWNASLLRMSERIQKGN